MHLESLGKFMLHCLNICFSNLSCSVHLLSLHCGHGNAVTMNDHCRFIMAASSVAPSSLIPKAYIGRIKDPKQAGNIYKKRDFLHAVIYEDPKESFEYLDLKNLVDEDNGLIFYTNGINKGNPVDWNKCVAAVKSRPPIGNVCIVMHDNPLTFGQFAELAYSKAVLTNSTAYDTLKAKLHGFFCHTPRPCKYSCTLE